MSASLRVHLTPSQKRSFNKGAKSIQLSAAQLANNMNSTKDHVLNVSNDALHKMQRNLKKGLGARLKIGGEIEGGGLFDQVKRMVGKDSVVHKLNAGIDSAVAHYGGNGKVASTLKKAAGKAADKVYAHDWDGTVGAVKGAVKKEAARRLGMRGGAVTYSAVAMPEPAEGGKLSLKKIGRSIKKGFDKAVKVVAPVAKKVAEEAWDNRKTILKAASPYLDAATEFLPEPLQPGAQWALQEAKQHIGGKGLGGRARLVKGSPEAKAWAAKMQAARRAKRSQGGSFKAR